MGFLPASFHAQLLKLRSFMTQFINYFLFFSSSPRYLYGGYRMPYRHLIVALFFLLFVAASTPLLFVTENSYASSLDANNKMYGWWNSTYSI